MKMIYVRPNYKEKEIEISIENVNDELEVYYEMLNCDMIDITTINVNGVEYDIIHDDEFLLKRPLVPTLYVNNELIIFGAFLISRANEDGEEIGLTHKEIDSFLEYMYRQQRPLKEWIKNLKQ